MTKRVGIVGTGMLGLAVSQRLIRQGFDVVAYNRTPSKAAPVVDAGGYIADTPAGAAASSDVVITVVRDAAAVEHVSFGPSGILSGCRGSTVVADMSTIAPADSVLIHHRFAAAGITWMDTPVMGGPDAAIEGRLTVMAGGDTDAFERHRDVFAALSQEIHHLGPAGTAHAIKLCMNLQIAMLAVSISEGICLARGLDVDPQSFLDVLNSTYFGTGMSRRKAYQMIRGEYSATFTLDNLAKDLRTIQDASDHAGLKLEVASRVLESYEKAMAAGFGSIDYTGILEYVQKNSRDS